MTETGRAPDLVETMRFDPVEGILRLDAHLARMKASAHALGFAFDRHEAGNALQTATFRLGEPAAVRLMMAPGGAMAIEARALPPAPSEPVAIAIVPLPLAPDDARLGHSIGERGVLDAARASAGTFEVLFADAAGFLARGSFTNLFVASGDRLVTPPLARARLSGVLRGALIAEGRAVEGELRAADLADGCLIGNALLGLVHARLAR